MRSRLDAIEVKLGNPLNVLEDSRQLACHPLDLFIAQLEPGELGDMEDLFPVDHSPDHRRRRRAGDGTRAQGV